MRFSALRVPKPGAGLVAHPSLDQADLGDGQPPTEHTATSACRAKISGVPSFIGSRLKQSILLGEQLARVTPYEQLDMTNIQPRRSSTVQHFAYASYRVRTNTVPLGTRRSPDPRVALNIEKRRSLFLIANCSKHSSSSNKRILTL